jgi:hypothetical protein
MSLRQFLIDSELVPAVPILLVYYYYYYDYLIITYINAPYGKTSIGMPSPNPYLDHLSLLDLCLLSQKHNYSINQSLAVSILVIYEVH